MTARTGFTAPAKMANVAAGTVGVQGIPAQTGLRLMGVSISEAAGTPAAASVQLNHGTSSAGGEIETISLSAGQSIQQWYGPDGIDVNLGVFANRLSGTTRLVLFYKLG